MRWGMGAEMAELSLQEIVTKFERALMSHKEALERHDSRLCELEDVREALAEAKSYRRKREGELKEQIRRARERGHAELRASKAAAHAKHQALWERFMRLRDVLRETA